MATGTVQGLVVLGAGLALFDVPARGGIAALDRAVAAVRRRACDARLCHRGARGDAARGLQGAVAFYLPAMLLSGFLYPAEALPGWARALGAVFPLTHLVRAARGAMLRGDGNVAVLAQGMPVALFLVAMLLLLWLLPRRVD